MVSVCASNSNVCYTFNNKMQENDGVKSKGIKLNFYRGKWIVDVLKLQ